MLAMMAIPLFVYAVNIKLNILVVHLCHIPYAFSVCLHSISRNSLVETCPLSGTK